jgi:hypothetical protein
LQLLEGELAARAAGSTEQITENMVIAKRDIFGELVEGVAAMKSHREEKSHAPQLQSRCGTAPEGRFQAHPGHSKEAALFKSGFRMHTAH